MDTETIRANAAKMLSREDLITEVEAYLESLCAIGAIGDIFVAFGTHNPDVKNMTYEALLDIYVEFIHED